MLPQREIFDLSVENKIEFFTVVPDSLMKDFCAVIEESAEKDKHVISANEGNAIALASGYHLATGKIGLVYMQNSGLGNAINPLVSLADEKVYGMPMLLVIGWRGEDGVPDEPQHKKQGLITLSLLDNLGIPYKVLSKEEENIESMIFDLSKSIFEKNIPHAIVVREGAFEKHNRSNTSPDIEKNLLSREEALEIVLEKIPKDGVVVSTTGKLSRELFELREKRGEGHGNDFLTVGSMGHSSSIALGIALAKPDKKVYCLDGDGASIMHLGSLAIIGQHSPQNFTHILFNNGSHDSVGGQPTASSIMDFVKIAEASNYNFAVKAVSKENIIESLDKINKIPGPNFIEIEIRNGARGDLGRPTRTPLENKQDFMEFLNDRE